MVGSWEGATGAEEEEEDELTGYEEVDGGRNSLSESPQISSSTGGGVAGGVGGVARGSAVGVGSIAVCLCSPLFKLPESVGFVYGVEICFV